MPQSFFAGFISFTILKLRSSRVKNVNRQRFETRVINALNGLLEVGVQGGILFGIVIVL